MPEPDFHWNQNDTSSSIDDTLLDDDGVAVDIQNATVKFQMRAISSLVAKINAAATNLQVGNGSDGSKGDVRYSPGAADTNTAGLFIAKWQVTFSGGAVQTFPNDRFLYVAISQDIG